MTTPPRRYSCRPEDNLLKEPELRAFGLSPRIVERIVTSNGDGIGSNTSERDRGAGGRASGESSVSTRTPPD